MNFCAFQKVVLPFLWRNALRCYDIYITPFRWGFPVSSGTPHAVGASGWV